MAPVRKRNELRRGLPVLVLVVKVLLRVRRLLLLLLAVLLVHGGGFLEKRRKKGLFETKREQVKASLAKETERRERERERDEVNRLRNSSWRESERECERKIVGVDGAA